MRAIGYEDLRWFYPEFEEYMCLCKFDNCIHKNEPVCGVKSAVEQGMISKVRYENYLLLLEECNSGKY